MLSAAEAAELPQLRIGVSYAPGAFETDGRGHYAGALYEHIEMLSTYAEFEPVYVPGSLDECRARLKNGELDAALVVRRGPLEADGILHVQRSILNMPGLLFMKDGAGSHERIGYCGHMHNSQMVREALDEYSAYDGVTYTAVPFETNQELREAWTNGSIDGVVATALERVPVYSPMAELFFATFDLGVREDRPELRTRLVRAMERARMENPDMVWEQVRTDNISGIRPLLLRNEEKAYLANHPVIRVSVFAEQAPYAYLVDGKVHGIYADFFARASHDLKVDFQLIPAKSYTESLDMTKDGRAEMVASAFADPSWARENDMWFTVPYMNASYTGIMRRDREGAPLVVAAIRGLYFTRAYVEKNVSPENIRYFDTERECIEAVRNGSVDIFYTKVLLAQLILAQPEFANLYSTGQSVMLQDVAMGVSRTQEPMLVRILDKEITHIGEAGAQAIVDQSALAIVPERSWRSFVYYHPLQTIFGVLLLALLFISIVIYVYRQRQSNYERLQTAAYRHHRNGLYNLRWFEENLSRLVEELKEERAEGRLYIMLSNVCHFDRLMAVCTRNEAAQLQREILDSFHKDNPWFYRYATAGTLNQSYALCRLPKGMKQEYIFDIIGNNIRNTNTRFPLTLQYNFGLVQIPAEGELHVQKLIQRAEIAQAEANETGALCCVYDKDLIAKRTRQQRIEHALEGALERGELEVWYQPKYNLYSGAVVGAETLVRWNSSELGYLMPSEFIPVLERTNLILKLDYYMLEHTMRYLKERMEAGLPVVTVSVNQSGRHMNEPGYLEHMQRMREEIALPVGLIELEITETAFVDYDTQAARENAVHVAQSLREMGYHLAMDDFCTGYSSIAMLQTLPMDTIKIDRAILLAAEADAKGRTIMCGVIDFGRRLNMNVLCEGIETEEQEQLLREDGCSLGQGFLFAKPMKGDAFAEFLDTHIVSDEML